MGPATQVLEFALPVQAHIFLGRNAGNDFSLVVLAHGLEVGHGLIARQNTANDGLVQVGQFSHFLFDGDQVLWSEWPLIRKIIIKAVFDDGPNGDLRVWEKGFDRIRQQMGR